MKFGNTFWRIGILVLEEMNSGASQVAVGRHLLEAHGGTLRRRAQAALPIHP